MLGNLIVYIFLGILGCLEIPISEVDGLEEIEHRSWVDNTKVLELVDNLNKIDQLDYSRRGTGCDLTHYNTDSDC